MVNKSGRAKKKNYKKVLTIVWSVNTVNEDYDLIVSFLLINGLAYFLWQ